MCSSAGHDPIVSHCAPVIGGSGQWLRYASTRGLILAPARVIRVDAGDTGHQSGCWQFVTNNTKYLCNIAMLLIGTYKLLPDKYLDFVTVVKP